MKKIGVFTSGGDSPGMNACVRAVVRGALYYGVEVYGIYRGYRGMIENDIHPMTSRDVSNIIQRGGTVLKTARSQRFLIKEGREQAYQNLKNLEIDGLVAIGGNGTLKGMQIFSAEHKMPFVGAPGTIDNDLNGTDYTIGFDTAINTALEAIDKIRDTADSLERGFFIEVMGRHCGDIALLTGIGGGAEIVMLPEIVDSLDEIVVSIKDMLANKKRSLIVVVAEGDELGNAEELGAKVREQIPKFKFRVTNLGHIQRGGSPTAADRVLGSQLGLGAVEGLLSGKTNVMVGQLKRRMTYTSIEECIKPRAIDNELVRMLRILST
ncbi:6-phosphofructokinase [Bernardetia sp. ABR2-2B]|uniref:6-phosphofructokinase n=1 Tax=Bernardetia sp. ABR2-2B TaxID=3127472 RepID=UPI0030CFD539